MSFQGPGTYTHGYSGTRYLIPAGFQAQPGTARHRPQFTLVMVNYLSTISLIMLFIKSILLHTVLNSYTYVLDVLTSCLHSLYGIYVL